MSVSYNSKKIIPAPLVSISKNYQRTGDNTKIGATYSVTVQGEIIAWKGSPNSSGVLWDQEGYPPDESIAQDSRLGAILRKQLALQQLFKDDGLPFEVHPWDGSQATTFYPRVLDIQFPEGIWTERCPYTITLEADAIYPSPNETIEPYIQDATENWQIDTDETPENEFIPQTYRLTHSISAVGKSVYTSEGVLASPAWQQARQWVQARMGLDTGVISSSGVLNLPSYYGGFNLVRTEQIEETTGSYFVTENWVLTSGNALEEFNISINKGIDNPFTTVGIEGTITGLEERDNNYQLTTHKFTNATAKYAAVSGRMLTRAQNYSDISLNIVPTRTSIGKNVAAGVITYNYEYDNRPSNIVPGALSEIINIQDSLVGQSFASIFILGRSRGPILQNLNTVPSLTRQLTIELVMPPANFGSQSLEDLKDAFNNQNPRFNPTTSTYLERIYDAANPANNGYTVVYGDPPQESWDAKNGRYTYSRTWTFENEV